MNFVTTFYIAGLIGIIYLISTKQCSDVLVIVYGMTGLAIMGVYMYRYLRGDYSKEI